MELRECSNLHFIQAIRNGLVVKTCNVNSYGKPALVFKRLEDIYETKDTKGSKWVSTVSSSENDAGPVPAVNSDNQSLVVADRTLTETDAENNEFVCSGSYGDSDSDDCIFANLTLKQLKERCKSKKRKKSSLYDINAIQEVANFQQEADEDFNVPLSVLKTKLSKKSKAKLRCSYQNTFPCSETDMSVKTEHILDPYLTMQLNGESDSLTTIKDEVLQEEFSRYPNTHSLANFSPEVPILLDEDSLALVAHGTQAHALQFSGHQHIDSFTDCSSINCDEELSCSGPISSDVSETIDVQEKNPMLFAEEHLCCTPNNVSTNDNLECVETTNSKNRFEINTHPHAYEGSLDIILHPINNNIDMHLKQHVISEQDTCDLESLVPRAILAGKANSTDIHWADDICMPESEVQEEMCSSPKNAFTTSPLEKVFPSEGSQINSSSDDDLKSVEDSGSHLTEPSEYPSADTGNSCLNTSAVQVESLIFAEKRSPGIVHIEDPTMKCQPSNVPSMIPTSVLQQSPQRLPLTRKAISPSSQERLCSEMISADLMDEAENYKCEENPLLVQGMVSCSTDGISKSSSQGCQGRVAIRREQIQKRLKNSQKGFPPYKANSDGPHFSRSLPQLSTGCTSVDSCSNNAIAFSQRQMHDFESLAMKLLDELKSMKDVVEEKLLFKAYRSAYWKNEVDEVRNTINNTKKVEETARKWMSMMTRDCTRFCKLMKLSQNDTPSEGTVQKERKITFADEAGGNLCSVNYFDDGVSSPVLPCDEKQED